MAELASSQEFRAEKAFRHACKSVQAAWFIKLVGRAEQAGSHSGQIRQAGRLAGRTEQAGR
jgi:hypothetical protein